METSFLQELYTRFKQPWSQSAFISYFILLVLLAGGFGVIISITECYHGNWDKPEIISKSMATYFVAVIGSSIVDLNLSYNIKNVPSWQINSTGAVLISALLFYLSYNLNGWLSILPAFFGVLLAISIWVLANADNERLNDSAFFQKMRGKEEGHGNNWG
ncbi:hypothetical protein EWM62_05265 [Mucilaginibacter terrigena]|uniref:Uncharacterized protein n=1 Tax=Mucilaginibacter terrigena TaxID=2492395 RepID=A0A4Q5LPL5_9SPHI|nr:hypothetical protein [Mucilaginibacter terrigena]RYU91351.1 hypothetical protein EWM62_05265 [Mucilaginibacter terrigena]